MNTTIVQSAISWFRSIPSGQIPLEASMENATKSLESTEPRWKGSLESAIENTNNKVFSFATVEDGSPRNRSFTLRQFLVPKSAPSLPLIICTTDVRSPKIDQITSNAESESVFWFLDTLEQYRIRGLVAVMPPPSHPLHSQFPSTRGPALQALKDENFDWEAFRLEVFNGLETFTRANFVRPIPGTKLEGGYDEMKKWPHDLPNFDDAETEEDKKNIAIAFERCALVIIDPDYVDLFESTPQPAQRTKFRREDKVWVKEIVVPG